MNKQEVYQLLDDRQISYKLVEHEAVYSMDELTSVELPYPECDAKNLFIRDDKKKNFYLITVKGNKRVNLKEFRKQHGTRPLTFVSAELLMDLMKLTPGSVSPLGILEDQERKIHFYVDEDFFDEPGIAGVHPNDNTATVFLKIDDLIGLIQEHGNDVHICRI